MPALRHYPGMQYRDINGVLSIQCGYEEKNVISSFVKYGEDGEILSRTVAKHLIRVLT